MNKLLMAVLAVIALTGTSYAKVDCVLVADTVVRLQGIHASVETLKSLADTCREGEATYHKGVSEKDYMAAVEGAVTKVNEESGNDPAIVQSTSLMAIADIAGYMGARREK